MNRQGISHCLESGHPVYEETGGCQLVTIICPQLVLVAGYCFRTTHYGSVRSPKWSSLLNPLECRGSYSATSNNMKFVHWPLMGGLLHLVQRGGDWVGPGSSSLYQM